MLVTHSCPTLCDPMDYSPPGCSVHGILQVRILEWVAIPFTEIFPTQRLNPGLLHCRWILYHLSNQESPKILEWIAYPFSRRSFLPRNQTRVCCIAGGFFTSWATREALYLSKSCNFSVLLDIRENLRGWVFVISFTNLQQKDWFKILHHHHYSKDTIDIF